MLIKDCLTRNGEHGTMQREDAMCFSTTEPESVGRVEVAQVADSVPELVTVLNLVQRVGFGSRHIVTV